MVRFYFFCIKTAMIMKKLYFEIDKENSLKQNLLLLHLFEDEKPSVLTRDEKRLDKETLNLLMELELLHQRKVLGRSFEERSFAFKEFHIPFPKTQEVLKCLSPGGKLRLNGQELICDFFSKVPFLYEIVSEEKRLFQVKGKLQDREALFDLTECAFICGGSPLWYVKGPFIKMISTEITWKELKAIYLGPLQWNEDDLEVAKDDSRENPSAPKILENIPPLNPLEKRGPLPLLILKDRVGMFADLWMNYGDGVRVSFHHPAKEFKDLLQKPVKRLLEEEKNWEKDLLETDFQFKRVDQSAYYCPADKTYKSLAFLLELGWEIHDHLGNRLLKSHDYHLEMDTEGRHIRIRGTLKFENYEANLTDVVGSFNRREKFIQLAPKVVGLVPQQWEEFELKGMIEEGEVVQDHLKVATSSLGLFGKELPRERFSLTPEIQELRQSLNNFEGIDPIQPGPQFLGVLRPYQLEGIRWLSFLRKFHFQGILADDMGLGKTVQVIAFLSSFERTLPTLIVMPMSLLFNWKMEIEKFLPHQRILIYHGLERKNAQNSLSQYDFILTSYATLRIDLPYLKSFQYEYLILDESQAIKNSDSKTAQALLEISSTARLSLTGTPLENHLFELWSQFHFLMPELLGTQKEFETAITAASSDSRHLDQIKKKIKPFILRRKKQDVAKDLPEKIQQTVWLDMPPGQREIYENFLASAKSNLIKKVQLDGVSKHRMEIFETLLRLRQICCHPLLNGSEGPSAKLEQLMEDIQTVLEEGKKVLIFSQFTTMLSLIKKEMNLKQWSYLYLDGETKNRQHLVEAFQNDPSASIFLISLKAGGVGLNLTAADYVFLYDPWWNEAVENQAIDRAHRIGRKHTVVAKRYVMRESIEEKIMTLKSYKTQLVEQLSSEDIAEGIQLTTEDFYHLIH